MSAVLGTYARINVEFERGEGAWLETAAGERYLDFGSGVAVNALGHAHPHLIAALTEQAHKVWHTSNLYRVPGQERLAERLCALTFADKVFFANSGAEAMECSIKMARKYHSYNRQPERWRVVTFVDAFHGRTLATIAAGNQEKHLKGFGPKVDGFDQVPVGDLDALRAAITPETAALLIEPIQGEGGVRPVGWPFLRALREIADEHGLLLILDEVQTGVGRTGKLFAHEWAGIEPDIMGIAKGIGGGFPVGACLATEKAASGMTAGSHGSTFGGNPLAMAVANAVLDIATKPEFLGNVQEMSLLFKQRLAEIIDRHPRIIADIRGEGLLLGLKCKVPSADVSSTLFAEKLLTVSAGDNVVRLLPPLIVTEAEIKEACDKIESACARLDATLSA
ncbi:aspartate aminotransferase family protein [Rhodomicrobium vannielii ATCC 17100]|uniref:aspartate aminotransferase family protein n=1 Tax=Rhodomicrobium vannielii TaxID=1069 RepID=UPI001918D5B3|nr:aspartate aminotransferase family protein [Rhodomicrobium vannielii]MBJ7535179.1 aspartate aminotransferase family protein [Rhodomicrobium vannielii ATCC 17100]